MACFNMAGLHAVARIPMSTACSRRPFEPMRATLHDAREPSALAGFDSFHVVSNRTRFGTPSSPSGSTKHRGTGVLLATRERPGVGRWHRATSLYLRKAKLFAKHIFPAGACFPCTRLFTISPGKTACADKTLFALRRTIWHSESPEVVDAERWIKKVRTPH